MEELNNKILAQELKIRELENKLSMLIDHTKELTALVRLSHETLDKKIGVIY